jgi:hypothetical protein
MSSFGVDLARHDASLINQKGEGVTVVSSKVLSVAVAGVLLAVGHSASAALLPVGIFNGNVAVSIDGIGSNSNPVGSVQAMVPAGSTILAAYLYSAGTPYPWYSDSPRTLADYNTAGISLAGTPVNNFTALVGAISTRADIGQWFTARADVTSLVQSLVAAGAGPDYAWSVEEGTKNTRIDGEVLAIVYSNPSLPVGSVALLDGGQNTGGETTNVALGAPLGDPTAAGFAAMMSIASTFSCCGQASTISVNGTELTRFAGNFDDGLVASDGSLITVGGIGDDPSNNVASYDDDDELYDLRSFLALGDTSFSIFTQNETNDDNIFFMGLYLTGNIRDINPTPTPEPGSLALLGLGLAGLGLTRRRQKG